MLIHNLLLTKHGHTPCSICAIFINDHVGVWIVFQTLAHFLPVPARGL